MDYNGLGTLSRFENYHSLLNLKVLSWFLIILFTAEFYTLYIPIFRWGWNIAMAIIMGILILISTITSIIIMLMDPSDTNVKKNHNSSFFKPKGKHVIDENYFCSICEVHV